MKPHEDCPRPQEQRRNLSLAPVQRWCCLPVVEPWTLPLAPRTGEPRGRCHSVGDLVLLYSAASDTRTGKPSPTSPVSERKEGASRVAGRLFSLSGFAELQEQPCSSNGRPQETQGPLPRGAGRNSSVNSSPKGIPCPTLHSRLPAREIKRVPGDWGRWEANRSEGNTLFPPSCCCP